MLDVSFSELIVIGIVALVVIGPERLPKVARTAGHLFGRLQRYVNDVKADISREMQLDELKKLKSEFQDSARNFERSLSSEMQAVEKSVEQVAQSVTGELKPASETPQVSVEASSGPAIASVETPPAAESPSGVDSNSPHPVGKG